MTMMIYDMSREYQTRRIMTAAEQRRADEQAGRMAAGASRFWRRLTRPARALARLALRALPSRTAAYAR